MSFCRQNATKAPPPAVVRSCGPLTLGSPGPLCPLCACSYHPGTANGGSALMWASMLELSRPGRGRVLTLDMNAPSSAAAGWAGANAKDPTKNPLWAKYVKFLQVGGS